VSRFVRIRGTGSGTEQMRALETIDKLRERQQEVAAPADASAPPATSEPPPKN